MNRFHLSIFAMAIIASPSMSITLAGEPDAGRVEVMKVPFGGIQPQVVIDDKGTVHLVAFRGEPAAGDFFYTKLEAGSKSFSKPITVNQTPGSGVATGTMRGAQIAIGREAWVHVAWNGSESALPKNAFGSTPMLYTRLKANGLGFEAERNLMVKTSALDGGGCLAADHEGNVYVGWHGRDDDAGDGEEARRMWIVRSANDGKTFTTEEPALDEKTGACGCCGTKAMVDRRGNLFLLYRAATNRVDRDIFLLSSHDQGQHFSGERVHPWKLNACPMSTASLAETKGGLLAAWETKETVYFARVDGPSATVSKPVSPKKTGKGQKHPSLAGNAAGESLLAWAEGTGWQRGGALRWQLFDRDGKPSGAEGKVDDGIPVWGLPAVAVRPDGSFLLFH